MCLPPIGMWAVIGVPRRSVAPRIRRRSRIVEAHEARHRPGRRNRPRNFELVADLVADRVRATAGPISAKRFCRRLGPLGMPGRPGFPPAGRPGQAEWRQGQRRGPRPGVWNPGETLIIDWGSRVACTCFVQCWRGHGSGWSGSPPMRKPPRP